jgi:endonuclease/exonuclease/phosphatase family metal-dependent hydrolase
MGHSLRVASYNLRDFKDDTDAAVRVVRTISPDVLCLQEVPRHPLSSYRIASFAARCGLYWSGGHHGSGGTTVMSSLRLDASNVQHIPLKVGRGQRVRGYSVSHVRLPGHQRVGFVSVHLSLDPDERATHSAAVMKALAADGLLVVAGDLNEGSDGQAWMALTRRLRVVSGDTPTFTAGNPRRRIDVIFASSELSVAPRSPIELDRADLVAATDHLPVWADLDLSFLAPR